MSSAATACACCARSFGCGVRDASCWCVAVEVPDEARARLAAAYDGCLCPACLRELADDPADAEAGPRGATLVGRPARAVRP